MDLAKKFHDTYERLAPEFGYKTREASAVPWEDVPEQNRLLMEATVAHVMEDAVREVAILNEALTSCEAELRRERAARRIVDQALSDSLGEVKTKETSTMDPENIKLEYPVIIRQGEDQYHSPKGAEFFVDEHGFQWVKFFPNNGYQRGMEHMMRTEGLIVVRDRERERRAGAAE